MSDRPRRRLVRPAHRKLLHLGSEYNANHVAAGPSMDALMKEFLAGRPVPRPTYFKFVAAQAGCFGEPRRFRYSDVSLVPAGGEQTPYEPYARNVAQTAPRVVALVRELDPELIVVAGGSAYRAFCEQILSKLPGWRGHLVKAWNPSAQAHRGKPDPWLARYRQLAATQPLRGARPAMATHWRLNMTAEPVADRLVRL